MSRVRRSASQAREELLNAAEVLLAERGVEGVRVQDVAARVGVAPATALHHFGSRDGLVTELMAHGAKTLRSRLDDIAGSTSPDLETLGEALSELYGSGGYAALYASLSDHVGSSTARPIFAPLLQRLGDEHDLQTPAQQERLAEAVLLLNLVAFAEALVGQPMRQAVGINDDGTGRSRLMHHLTGLLTEMVDEE